MKLLGDSVKEVLEQVEKLAEVIGALDKLRSAGDAGQAFHMNLNAWSPVGLTKFLSMMVGLSTDSDDSRHLYKWEKNTGSDNRTVVQLLYCEYKKYKQHLSQCLSAKITYS